MFACFIAALASGATCTEKECEFLGMGYNIINGDPNANGNDPGWTHQIFSPQWIEVKGNVYSSKVCTYDSVVSSISGGKSAQVSLKKDSGLSASAGAFGGKIAFTGSESLNTMNDTAWSHSKHYVDARATCQLFFAKLPAIFLQDAGGPPVFLEEFVDAVRGLPAAKDEHSDKTLENWMKNYGTHYSRAITLGGMEVRRWTMNESDYHTLQEDSQAHGWTLDAGYQGAFEVSAGVNNTQENAATQAVQKAAAHGQVHSEYRGGIAFVKGNPKEWAAGLENESDPAFLGYLVVPGEQNSLGPIMELLTQDNFPGLDPGVKTTAEEFAQRLCTPGGSNLGFENCTTEAKDANLCHCTKSGKTPDHGMIQCTLYNAPEHKYCEATQTCSADTNTFVPFGQWDKLCKDEVNLCHCTESGAIECSVTGTRYCISTQKCFAPVDKKVPAGEWGSLCADKAVNDGDGYLDCQPGCEVRPTPELAAAICKANKQTDPSKDDALQKYNCELSDNGWPYLADHMCLCDKPQPTYSDASVCSDGCGGWGCCTPGQICMSSKILNSSDFNRCFDVRTEWTVKDYKVVIDKSDTDQTGGDQIVNDKSEL